jgi:hypothetical protein
VSRWPRGIDAAYLQHESEQRFARVEALMERRRREYARNRSLLDPIVDRDTGDEDDTKEGV